MQVCQLRWTCNDEFIIASVNDKSVKVFDARNGKVVHVLKGHTNQVFCISCSSFDPYLIVTGCHDGLIFCWDIKTGQQLFKFKNKTGVNLDENGAIHALSLTPDDSLSLVAADSHGNVLFFSFGLPRPCYSHIPEQVIPYFNHIFILPL